MLTCYREIKVLNNFRFKGKACRTIGDLMKKLGKVFTEII